MLLSSQNLALIRTELDELFMQEFDYDATDPTITTARTGSLFQPETTTHGQYIGEIMSDVGLWDTIGEIQEVPEATPRAGNKYTIQIADYAKGVSISKDFFDDNLFGYWSRIVKQLAFKGRVTQDSNAFAIFRNAFTTQLSADGVSLINAAHPLLGGGTASNVITGPLTDVTLNDAVVALRQQVDQSGVVLGGTPTILVVPPALFKKAAELTQSVLTPFSANNAVNIYRSLMGIQVMSSPYLGAAAGGSDTAWFLLTRNHSVRRLVRQGIETALTNWTYSKNRTYFYQANFRESYYAPDFAGIVGSTGL